MQDIAYVILCGEALRVVVVTQGNKGALRSGVARSHG